MARDAAGNPVDLLTEHHHAVKWSLYGAPKWLRRFDLLHVEFAYSELRRAAFPRTLQQANDFGNRHEALMVVDKALHACGFQRRGGWSVSKEGAMPVHRETRAALGAASSAPAATPPGARRLAS